MKKLYEFWIKIGEPGDVEEVRWTHLTAQQAMRMYDATRIRQPGNVLSFGWEEMK